MIDNEVLTNQGNEEGWSSLSASAYSPLALDREPKFTNGGVEPCGGKFTQKKKYTFGQIGGPLDYTSALPSAESELGAVKPMR